MTTGRYRAGMPALPTLALLVLAGWAGSALAAQEWPSVRGNPALTGMREAPLLPPFQQAWRFQASEEISSAAAVAQGRVVFSCLDGSLYCLEQANGLQRWRVKLGIGTEAPPLIAHDRVYIGDGEGVFHCRSLSTGATIWTYSCEGKIAGGATIASLKGRPAVLFGSYDRKLYCLDAASGRLLWSYRAGNYINGAPAVEQDRVVFGACDGKLRILSLESGKELFSLDAGSYVPASPALLNHVAYAASYGGRLLAFSTATARLIWSTGPATEQIAYLGAPAVSSGALVVGGKDGVLRCFESTTGHQRWEFVTGGDIDSSPLIAGSAALVASGDGWLYLVDLKSGRELWSTELGGSTRASPVAADDMVFIGSPDGRLTAWKSLSRPAAKESSK